MGKRQFREFHYKEAHFHILSPAWDAVAEAIISNRHQLEAYIEKEPRFASSLVPLDPPAAEPYPPFVKSMLKASEMTGLGPMAAVAGTMAQIAAEVSVREGSSETIIENGGDIYIDCREEVILGLYPGKNSPFADLALNISPEMMPLAICTSSGRMGHSLSFGDCDIFSVFSRDASLADAAATLGCNSIKTKEDIEPVLNRIMEIEGIVGALAIRDRDFGAVGTIPELIRSADPEIVRKVSKDEQSNFQ